MGFHRIVGMGIMFGLAAVVGTVGAHEWKAPEQAAELSNPTTADKEYVAAGKSLYQQHCAYCHGDDMGGMRAEAAGLSKAAPDLIKNLSMHSEGGFFWKIREGRGDMPAFKEVLSEEEIWSIVTAIKQAAGEK